jgi:hypothetical protein
MAFKGSKDLSRHHLLLTIGKRDRQEENALQVSELLTEPIADDERRLRMRWLALVLYLSADVARYAEQFEDILSLSGC